MKKVKLKDFKVILASKSPWRRRLLKKHGIACKIHISGFHEVKKHKSVRQLVIQNARGKAMTVAKNYKDAIVIGVDTVGVIDGIILGKAENRAKASAMLMRLRGRRHKIYTGLCVIDTASGKKYERVVTTSVVFRKFTGAELKKYLASNQWRGKAGSYAVQGRAKSFVEHIIGDVTNVIGLPMPTLLKILNTIRH